MILLLLYILATPIECNLDVDQCIIPYLQTCASPTPTIMWNAVEDATGYLVEWRQMSSDTSEPFIQLPLLQCYEWPIDTAYPGEIYCPGELDRPWKAVSVALQRYITTESSYFIEICVRAERDGAVSVNCSELLSYICWPELLEFP